jgi:hypothetical protein
MLGKKIFMYLFLILEHELIKEGKKNFLIAGKK